MADLGRGPTAAEIAEHTGLGEEAVFEAREALASRSAVSFSQPVAGDDDGRELGDGLGISDPGFDQVEVRATVEGLLRRLNHREREIVRLRFDEDLTQLEIGARMSLSQMHISRLLRDALVKLREHPAGV
jgi:RNA polymerase sigma-B factor